MAAIGKTPLMRKIWRLGADWTIAVDKYLSYSALKEMMRWK